MHSSTRTLLASAALVLISVLAGCGTGTPYFLVESKLVESSRLGDAPDVTETPTFRRVRGDVRVLGLRPPDVCADQGLSTSAGEGSLQLGVLRTLCGVEMAELERSLARSGYEVVSWGALQHKALRQQKPLLDAAMELEVDVVLQVNALERIDIRPGRDARWERRFYRATRTGEMRDPARVEQSRAAEFERLVRPKEQSLQSEKRVGAMINASAVLVESGSSIWFYEWTRVDRISAKPRIEVLVSCQEQRCSEVRRDEPSASSGPVTGSISGVSTAGDPADESQAIFHDLVRELVTDLADRFAGRKR